MKIIDLLEIFNQNKFETCVVILSFMYLVQISPIKINPWEKIGELIRSFLMKDVQRDIQEVKKEVREIAVTTDDNEVWRLRHEILDFSNSCKNGRKHTKDEFEHILEAHDRYETIIKKRQIKNGVMDIEHQYIRDVYRKRLENDDFLN